MNVSAFLQKDYKNETASGSGKNGQPGTRGKSRIELSLFDLDTDVSETTNVAFKHPAIVAKLQALAQETRKDLGDRKQTGKNVRPVGKM